MSSGDLDIFVFGTRIIGRFENGQLKHGSMIQFNVKFTGTFNDRQQLHGDNCEEDRFGIIKTGQFSNGILVKGTSRSSTYYSEGIFENGQLSKGLHIIGNTKYIGTFRNGFLQEGQIEFPDEIHVGKFSFNKLVKGYISALNGTFRSDILYENGILKLCYTIYDGDIIKLNKTQLMLLCCSGKYCNEALLFFQEKLAKLNTRQIVFATCSLSEEELPDSKELGQIAENLKRYKNVEIPNVEIPDGPVKLFENNFYSSH